MIAVGCALVIGVATTAEAQSKRRYISIGSGGPAGAYFKVASALCDVINSASQKRLGANIILTCTAAPSGGSAFNVRQVSIGAFTFGLVQSDDQYHALNGTRPQRVRRVPALRSVFSLYPEAFQLVVSANSGVQSFRDLTGKVVNVGNPGSGTRNVMEELLNAYGMSVDDFAGVTRLTSTEYGVALCDGSIDAFAAAIRFPASAVAAATDTCGARIVPLDSVSVRSMITHAPFFKWIDIPEGTYASTTEAVPTFAVVATLATHEKVGADVVYELVRAIMSHIEMVRSKHPALVDLRPEAMIADGLTAPLHPGAARYYRERKWIAP